MRSNKEIIAIGEDWIKSKNWEIFDFQRRTWNAFLDGKSGLLNAPTGSGKTYALWIPAALEYLKDNELHEIRP